MSHRPEMSVPACMCTTYRGTEICLPDAAESENLTPDEMVRWDGCM